MKLWIDDVRPAPEGYVWLHSVNQAKECIRGLESNYGSSPYYTVELISLDHDAGDYASDGGDYIRLLDWFEVTGRNYPIRIHSANVVGVENMRRIIRRNGWTEVF